MLILGVDTSGKNGSIALVEFEQASPRPLEVVPLEGGTFSAQLVPQISDLLKRHNRTRPDIDAFAVVSGPGSFTGLRVGLAAIKALAEILEKPIAAISLLEAVARISGLQGDITTALDAGRDELYAADFSIAENRTAACNQRMLTREELISATDRQIVTCDAKIADFATQRGLRSRQVPYPKADFIATLGFEKLSKGESINPLDLDANYIRRSDAELKRGSPR
ncbi:MAG TPA: tRNA (adenosine(37)-N6)-threonylcarbamoyltransferase complex dimerization subunit type 1 TsaB [Terriglobales bacterium]|nr:tRNA (adenosine(37)-N6)-threonylcarbamoyltransferase complex dimerization subunit type 1 TsaB [Terriglobales bacterium]